MRSLPFPLAMSAACVVLLLTGCESRHEDPPVATAAAESRTDTPTESDAKAVDEAVAALASGKDQTKAQDSKQYDDAVADLIRRGARIENVLIDHLRRSNDWGIRLGLVEVLTATGTKASVDHLIAVLDDSEPLVALRANTALQEMTQHREIPDVGAPIGTNGLPPVPTRDPLDVAMDAEQKLWSTWHQQHGPVLKRTWTTWWSANRDQVMVR